MPTQDTAGLSRSSPGPEASTAFRTMTVLASIAGVCALAVDYGFRPLPQTAAWIVRSVEVLVLGLFFSHSVLRLWWARQKLAHLRRVWYEFALAAVIVAALVAVGFSGRADRSAYFLLVVQLGIFLFLFIRLTELFQLVSTSRIQPAQILVTSFAMLIAVGTGLLMLPASASQMILVRDSGDGRAILRGNILDRTDEHIVFQDGSGNRIIAADRLLDGPEPADPADWSTALFTATSAVCVTGLIVESTGGYWSPFGQTVILVLIQLGGLGIMTFGAVFAMLLWQSLGLRQSAVMKDMVGPTMSIQVSRVLVFILVSTVAIEALGVWVLWGLWDDPAMSTLQRAFWSVFHAISAFCNAGFCLYDSSLERYGLSWQANAVFPALIITGGLGFMVTYNLARAGHHRLWQGWQHLLGRHTKPDIERRRLTLQSKLVLVTTVTLLILGAGLAVIFESVPDAEPNAAPQGQHITPPDDGEPDAADAGDVVMRRASPPARIAYGWFLSTTARTAGFNTVTTGRLTDSSKFLTVMLMFIGASPGSTGGGIKTVTLAVTLCGIANLLRDRATAQAYGRTIPQNILLRSLVVLTLAAGVVAAATITLSVTQPGIQFLDALFEATSAFGTVGLSTGVTGSLNLAGRLLIMAVMFAGRIGPLTLFIALPLGVRKVEFDYPTETVAIG